MIEVKNFLVGKYHITDIIEDEEDITHIYFEDNMLYYVFIGPHSGNDYHYLLRANAKKTFDRWSVAEAEYRHKDPILLCKMLDTGLFEIYRDILKAQLED